jgi:hypothetical protein
MTLAPAVEVIIAGGPLTVLELSGVRASPQQ